MSDTFAALSWWAKFSFLVGLQNTLRIQMMEVVTIARMVPTGIDFWASRRSPDRFEPAIMPGGCWHEKIIKSEFLWLLLKCKHILTSDRWEVDANQQSEKSSDVIDYIGHFDVLGRVTSPKRWQFLVFNQHRTRAILWPHILYKTQ